MTGNFIEIDEHSGTKTKVNQFLARLGHQHRADQIGYNAKRRHACKPDCHEPEKPHAQRNGLLQW
jgi:hypothetical protein